MNKKLAQKQNEFFNDLLGVKSSTIDVNDMEIWTSRLDDMPYYEFVTVFYADSRYKECEHNFIGINRN